MPKKIAKQPKRFKQSYTHEEVMDMLGVSKQRRRQIEEDAKYYISLMELKEQRRKLGWTQVKLAKKSGVPRETISRIESGNRNTTIGKMQKIAKAMGCVLEINFRATS
jgi:transcriptional regulator with XRE-family HTH domain